MPAPKSTVHWIGACANDHALISCTIDEQLLSYQDPWVRDPGGRTGAIKAKKIDPKQIPRIQSKLYAIDISKDPRVRKQVEWQTFKQVCGWAAVNTVLEELVTCHCAGAPLRLGASTQTQVHVIYRYNCHFAHSMTCPWVCRVVVPHAGNTDNTVQKVNISERSAVHQTHTCLIQISTQAHGSHGLKSEAGFFLED